MIISNEEATKPDFVKALRILVQLSRYYKYAGITEFQGTLESIGNKFKEIIRLWGTPLFLADYGNNIRDITKDLDLIITNLSKILRAI